MNNVKLLFGVEFWEFLEKCIQTANKYVFIFSAFAKPEDINLLVKQKKTDVPYLILVRDDAKKIEQENIIYVNKDKFHAKIYIIDDTIIIGSQNIYKVVKIPLEDKTGELSVAFKTKDSVNIIYQSLMIVLRDECESYYHSKIFEYQDSDYDLNESSCWINFCNDYNLKSFLNISSNSCPCCGSTLNFKENETDTIYCQEYNEDISANECGDGEACKYCLGNREIIEPQNLFSCSNCDFKIGYTTVEEEIKRQHFSWNSLSLFNVPDELKNFLKLYFYLINQVGENNTNFLLSKLNILGNLKNLNLKKRYYELESIK